MNVLSAAKKVSGEYFKLLKAAIVLLFLILAAEFSVQLISKLDFGLQYSLAKSLGSSGVFLALIALLFYPVRKAGMKLGKNVSFFSSEVYRNISAAWALLHPVIALCAFFLLFIHGFIFLKVLFNFELTIVNTFGLSALTFLSILLISGSMLKKKLSEKRLRTVHFFISFCFIVFFILHRSFM